MVGKKIKGVILRGAAGLGWHGKKVLARTVGGGYESGTMFPLISTLCLFGGLFLVLAKVLLFAVEMVIVRYEAGDGDEG